MTTKNKITFSNKDSENVEDFLRDMDYLSLANNWKPPQVYANVVISLKGQALAWFKVQDTSQFKVNGEYSVDALKKALKERFAKEINPADIVFRITEHPQRFGESCETFLTRILPEFQKLEISEHLQAGLLIGGFRKNIRDKLKMKDCKTIPEIEKWSRRFEDMDA